jgi:hypothetical protein
VGVTAPPSEGRRSNNGGPYQHEDILRYCFHNRKFEQYVPKDCRTLLPLSNPLVAVASGKQQQQYTLDLPYIKLNSMK